jgi:hypothetical protein
MPLSDRSKKCICIKEYVAPTNEDTVTFLHKVGRTYNYLDYDYAPNVIGIYGKNNVLLVGITIEDFKNHFQEKK